MVSCVSCGRYSTLCISTPITGRERTISFYLYGSCSFKGACPLLSGQEIVSEHFPYLIDLGIVLLNKAIYKFVKLSCASFLHIVVFIALSFFKAICHFDTEFFRYSAVLTNSALYPCTDVLCPCRTCVRCLFCALLNKNHEALEILLK